MKRHNACLSGLTTVLLFILSCQAPTSAPPSQPGTPAPGAPTGLTASAGDEEATVSWTPVSDATSYNLYYSTSSGVTVANGTKVGGITGQSSTKTGLSNGTTYYFIATAVNAGGESPASAQVSATPQVPQPGAPTSVSAAGGKAQIEVSWTAADGATSYNLYYSTTSGVATATGTKVTGVTSPYTVTPLSNGTTYYVIVEAVNPGGQVASNQASATTTAAYTLTTAASAGGSVSPSSPGSVYHGDETSLTATPDSGYTFVDWTVTSGSGVSIANPTSASTTVTLTGGNATVRANFVFSLALWARTATATSPNTLYSAVATDGTNFYAAGTLGGTGLHNFGNGVSLTAANASGSAFVVKYDASGTAQWARSVAGSEVSSFKGVAVDGSGNVWAVGSLIGSTSFDFGNSITAAGPYSAQNSVIVKYNSSGTAQWVQAGTLNGTLYAVTIDSSGKIVTAGSSNSGTTALVAQYSIAGETQWSNLLNFGGSVDLYAVASDTSGNIFVAGANWGSSSFSFGNGVTAQGTNNNANVLLVKYNSSGTAQWARSTTQGTNYSYFWGVVCDGSGNAYAAGGMVSTGTYGFGNSVLAAGPYTFNDGFGPTGYNPLLVKYDASGTAQWARTAATSTASTSFRSIARDGSGKLYLTGSLGGTGTVGLGNGVSATGTGSGANSLLAQFDSSGTAQWTQTVATVSGISANNGFSAGVLDSSGNFVAAGYYYGSGTFKPGPGISLTGNDFTNYPLLVKYVGY